MTRSATTVAVMLIVATSLLSALPASAAKGAASTTATGATSAPGVTAAVAADINETAVFVAESDTVETGADFNWNVMFEIQNPASTGLYLDSLRCDVQDLDEGESNAPRHLSIDLTRLAKLAPTTLKTKRLHPARTQTPNQRSDARARASERVARHCSTARTIAASIWSMIGP